MLKKINGYVCVFLLAAFFLAPFASRASATDEDTAYLLELINEIRLDPFTSAEALGYDRAALAETLPWLKASYEPYVMDDFLSSRAEAENSLDGEIPESEIPPEHDYARTGETGAVVGFLNFMPLKTAFRIIVENLLKQELNPDSVGQSYLLGTDFTRIGVSVRGGVQEVDGLRQNAYFITLCFGSSLLKSEVQVLTMVNQVRARPVSVRTYVGVSFFKLLKNRPNFLFKWYRVYPPLMDSSILYGSAQSYSKQLISFAEDASLPLDSDPLVRALGMGYDGLEVVESVSLREHPVDESSAQIANVVFSSLVNDELERVPERGSVFSLGTSDGGVGIAFASFDDDQVKIIGSVLDAGVAAVDDGQAGIYGVVYFDNDGNGIYSPGEGYGSASVVVFRQSDNAIVKQTVTDNAGHFSLSLVNQEVYRVEVSAGETMESLEIIIDQDLFLPVKLELPRVSS